MKKIYVTLLFTASIVIGVNAQSEKEKGVRYVYSESTPEAYEELKHLIKENEELKELALLKYENANLKGKVVLSTKQYNPIKAKISEAPINPVDDSEIEMKVYAKDASSRYVCVTDLLK